jgi:hypothetical protein
MWYHNGVYSLDHTRNRRRTTLLTIILATIPCYCLGFVALSLTPGERIATPTPTPGTPTVTATETLIIIPTTAGPSPTPNILTATDAQRYCDSHPNVDCLANAIPAPNQYLYTDQPAAPHSDIYTHKHTHHTDQYVYADQHACSSVGYIYIDP